MFLLTSMTNPSVVVYFIIVVPLTFLFCFVCISYRCCCDCCTHSCCLICTHISCLFIVIALIITTIVVPINFHDKSFSGSIFYNCSATNIFILFCMYFLSLLLWLLYSFLLFNMYTYKLFIHSYSINNYNYSCSY